jgi:hypothetical protein
MTTAITTIIVIKCKYGTHVVISLDWLGLAWIRRFQQSVEIMAAPSLATSWNACAPCLKVGKKSFTPT